MLSIFTKSKNSFQYQLPGEKTILLTRKHWFKLFVPILIIVFLTTLPFLFYFFINSPSLFLHDVFWEIYWLLARVYFLILWNLLFYNIMIYSLNTVAVTNKRIIENKQGGLYKHTVNELSLDKIQDTSIKIHGPLAEFLGFGDVEIQTAGAKNKFSFRHLPCPQRIKNIIIH